MEQETVEYDETCEVDGVPVSPLLSLERKSKYGSVPDLDDEELADPDELERQVYIEMYGPVLQLPYDQKHGSIWLNGYKGGKFEWGTFGMVDFYQRKPEVDKPLTDVCELIEEHMTLTFLLHAERAKLPHRRRYKILRSLRRGKIELDQITNKDLRKVGELSLRVAELYRQIYYLGKAVRDQRRARRGKRVRVPVARAPSYWRVSGVAIQP